MKKAKDIHKLLENVDLTINADADNEVLEKVLGASRKSRASAVPRGNILRIFTKAGPWRLAAAAVIIVAVLLAVNHFGGSTPAFAEIVRPLLTARSATFKMTTDIEGSPPETMDCMYMESVGTREVRPGGVIRILKHHQVIRLWPAGKKALILKRTNIPEDKQRHTNWFHEIREWIRQAQETEEESIKFLGKQEIDGVKAFGYRIRIGEISKMTDRTVWADAETLLPIRIEYSIGSGSPMGIKGTITYSDFVFNVEMDESLFVVPEGYDVNTKEMDVSKTREEDLIQALRLWSENTDGKFPSELNMKAAGKLFELIEEKMGLKFEEGEAPDFTKPQFSEFYPIPQKIIRGLGFKSKLPSESDWHYAGKGVKLGDADTPIFWYRPEGSETYRVIFGDLSVKDVTPENLPK